MKKGRQGRDRPARPSQAPAAPAPVGNAARGLQRMVGNRAAAQYLQREMTTTAAGLAGLQRGRLGSSSFAQLRQALKRYEKADEGRKAAELQRLSELCMKWLDDHRDSDDKLDARRWPYVEKLLDEVSAEQAKLTQAEAQRIYSANMTDPESPHALKALTQESRDAAGGKLMPPARKLADAKGLTRAEVAAIQTFTGKDYTYTNPASANDRGWLQANINTYGLAHSEKVLMEEGSLHIGVAMQGMQKLDPDYGTVFRGQSYTQEEFRKFRAAGVLDILSFSSASREQSVAESFAHSSAEGRGKEIAVVLEVRKSGGRDVSKLSLAGGEKEVTLLPGSRYEIQTLTRIAAPAKYAGSRAVKEWWKAVVAPAEKPLPELPDDL